MSERWLIKVAIVVAVAFVILVVIATLKP